MLFREIMVFILRTAWKSKIQSLSVGGGDGAEQNFKTLFVIIHKSCHNFRKVALNYTSIPRKTQVRRKSNFAKSWNQVGTRWTLFVFLLQAVLLTYKLQHTWIRSTAPCSPRCILYRPAVFFRPLRLTELLLQQGKFRKFRTPFKTFISIFYFF
jgi:hypothetical protein